jgi:hypothetical protein
MLLRSRVAPRFSPHTIAAYGAALLAATTFVNTRQTPVDDFVAFGGKFPEGTPMSASNYRLRLKKPR